MKESHISSADPLHGSSWPETYWSTTNVAEAMPGVQTPLGWTVWAPICELGIRGAFASAGAIPRSEAVVPQDPRDRTYNIFFGRAVLQVDFFYKIGNRMPGTDGASVVKQWLDHVPPEFSASTSVRRYPFVAAMMPTTFVRVPTVVRQLRAENEAWYRGEQARISTLGRDESQAAFSAAIARLDKALRIQARTVLCGVQPVFDQLERLIESVGGPTTGLLRGYGSHEETRMVEDLWACSRDELDIAEFLGRHGYHGPNSGELSAVVWREDPAPVHRLIASYRELGDDKNPAHGEHEKIAQREVLEAELLAAVPRSRRLGARAILELAHRYLPLRGTGKVAFLQALDVSRAAARQYGRHLTDAGVLQQPDDVFMLTATEVTKGLPADVRAVVEERRAEYERFQTLDLPSAWQGEPTPIKLREKASQDRAADEARLLTGTGCSPGVVEGVVRVCTDPADEDVEGGEILVTRTTDPSWASIMFLSSALVVDIGGKLSHAAIVARELGVPCVMGTGNAVELLRTGDRCRVDGNAGTVEILQRAGGVLA
ncbi:PEP-utilizing protein mobile region [Mycolicibacterium rhodesiae JS60]|nr:PEP-utilizing protein mobile region [Mycolicibacterium rhodesiae JS60]